MKPQNLKGELSKNGFSPSLHPPLLSGVLKTHYSSGNNLFPLNPEMWLPNFLGCNHELGEVNSREERRQWVNKERWGQRLMNRHSHGVIVGVEKEMICFNIIFKWSQLPRKTPLPTRAEILKDLRWVRSLCVRWLNDVQFGAWMNSFVWAISKLHRGGSNVTELNIWKNSQAFSYGNLPHGTDAGQRWLWLVVHLCFTIYVVLLSVGLRIWG